MIAYPIAPLPNVIQFQPDGGPSGGPAFKLDMAGAQPTILAIAKPLQKLNDWSTSVEMLIDTSAMTVTDNGFEGCGIRTRLLRQGATAPYALPGEDLLEGQSDDWHTKKETWHSVTQRIDYGVSEQPDVEDIQFCAKGPVGNSVKIAQLSVINQYSRYYETEVTGQSSGLSMTRSENLGRVWLRRSIGDFTSRTVVKTQWTSYLDTIATNIQAGETVSLTFSGILGAISFSDSDVPITLKASIKFTTPGGDELWKDIVSTVGPTAIIQEDLIEGSIQFISEQNFTQAEMAIVFFTNFGRLHIVTVSHQGMFFNVTTNRPIISNG